MTIPFMTFSFQELSDKQVELATLKQIFNDEAYIDTEMYQSFRVGFQKEKKSDCNTCSKTGYI